MHFLTILSLSIEICSVILSLYQHEHRRGGLSNIPEGLRGIDIVDYLMFLRGIGKGACTMGHPPETKVNPLCLHPCNNSFFCKASAFIYHLCSVSFGTNIVSNYVHSTSEFAVKIR